MEKKNCRKSELLKNIQSLTKEELETLVDMETSKLSMGLGTGSGDSSSGMFSGDGSLHGEVDVCGIVYEGGGNVFCTTEVVRGGVVDVVSATFNLILYGGECYEGRRRI